MDGEKNEDSYFGQLHFLAEPQSCGKSSYNPDETLT